MSQFIEMLFKKPITGKIGDLVDKKIFSVKKIHSMNDIIEYIDISSVERSNHSIVETTSYVVSNAPSRAQQCVRLDDILVSTVRPINRNIAVVNSDKNNLVASTGFCVLRPKLAFKEYLLAIVQSDKYTEAMIDKASGGLYPAVNNGDVLNYGIYIPDEEFAKKFSLIYQQADKSKFGDFKSQFIEMFGDSPTKELRDVCIQSGEYGSNTPADTYDGNTRYVRITDINDYGKLNKELVSPRVIEEKYLLTKNDLLFARTGNTVGKTYLHEHGRMIYAGYLIRYRLNKEIMLPEFAFAFTHTSIYYDWVERTKKVGAQPNISAAQYDKMPILVPSMGQQRAFVAVAEQADKSKSYVLIAFKNLESMLRYCIGQIA